MSIGKWLGLGPEDETPRDGVLSARAEWHAFVAGLAVGTVAALLGGTAASVLMVVFFTASLLMRPSEITHIEHIRSEPVYAVGGAALAFYAVSIVDVAQHIN